MEKPRILLCDYRFEIWKPNKLHFRRKGNVLDCCETIEEAIDLLSSNNTYNAIIQHLNMQCPENIREKAKRWVERLGLFKTWDRRFDLEWVPGGAIFLTYLHQEGYPKIKIATSGTDIKTIVEMESITDKTYLGVFSTIDVERVISRRINELKIN